MVFLKVPAGGLAGGSFSKRLRGDAVHAENFSFILG
jgi:hypothetical protein